MAWKSLYDWCLENGERGKQLLHEFGNGNNEQVYENDFGMMQAPQDYSYASHTKIKWTCAEGHTWESTIKNRTHGNNCPFCSGRKASEENNLLTWCKQNGAWGQQLIDEWINLDEQGNKIEMTELTRGSSKKVIWTCSKDNRHQWVDTVSHRTSKYRRGCPFCANQVIAEGINDLKTWCLNNEEYKHLIKEWMGVDEKGNKIEMGQVARATAKKVKWRCSKGHEWTAAVSSRTSKDACGCPVCKNLLVVEGVNDLKTLCLSNEKYKHLLDEWVGLDENNNKIEMAQVSKGSNKKVKWRCSKGHEWTAIISSRASNRMYGCPLCSGHALDTGINDLLTWCDNHGDWGEKLKSEWVGLDENNNKIEMTGVARATHLKVWWKCSEGHKWLSKVLHRTITMEGCPYCFDLNRSKIVSDARTKVGENDLLTWCNKNGAWGEKLKSEWVGLDENNNKIEMTEIARGVGRAKVWWQCSKNHMWLSTVAHRTIDQRGCPYCSNRGTSYPEQFLFRALQQIYPNTINRGKYNGYEYDIMITDTTPHVYIEYSAINWHINKLDRDELKASICKENNIRFIQIYAHSGQIETDEDIFDENQIIYRVDNDSNIHNQQLTEILQHILNSLGHNISEINIEQAQTEAFNFMHDIEEDEEELDDF